MTAVAVAARLALDTLKLRAGEVEAALSLGLSERDSRMEIIGQSATNALLPNLDSTRTVGRLTASRAGSEVRTCSSASPKGRSSGAAIDSRAVATPTA